MKALSKKSFRLLILDSLFERKEYRCFLIENILAQTKNTELFILGRLIMETFSFSGHYCSSFISFLLEMYL